MKRTAVLCIALMILFLALTSCAGSGTGADSQYGEGVYAESTPEMRWAAVPAVFVNDTWFRIFDDRQHTVPELDDTWVYIGTIQSAVPGWESPTQNFQTNNEAMVGSEIFYSAGRCIAVNTCAWGDPIDEVIVGDSIIVVYEGSRLYFISDEAHNEVMNVMNTFMRHTIMVDGVMYSLMATASGGSFSLSENHIFLGEITSTASMDEYPTENLQANRNTLVGAKVYKLPSGEINDIVVFFNSNTRFYFKHFPEVYTHFSEHQDLERVDLGCCVTDIAVHDTALLGANTVEFTSNDFIMTLNSDKHIYSINDEIQIWATLEYIGDNDTVEIWHGCPFMLFSISGGGDIDFGHGLGGFTVDVLASSVLERGRVYHFDYQKSGGWSADDPNAKFWEDFFAINELLLPTGEYTITLAGSFGLSENITDNPSGLEAELKISVE